MIANMRGANMWVPRCVVQHVVAGRKARALVAVLAMAIVVEVETLRNLLTFDVICLFSMIMYISMMYS